MGLPHRHIRSVTQLMALLHQASRRLARSLGHAATSGYWKHRAAVEMRPDAVGQVRVAPPAHVCTDAERIKRGNFSQVESCCATNALGDLVVPTVDEEECAFLDLESLRLLIRRKLQNERLPNDGIKKVWSRRAAPPL